MRKEYVSPQVSDLRLEAEQPILASSAGLMRDYDHDQIYWDVESDNEFE